MKATFIALALAASAFTGVAHADMKTDGPTTQSVSASTHRETGKTRAEVRRELAQAQKDGQIASLANLYRGS